VGVGTASQVLAEVTAESIRGVQGKVLPIGLQYRQWIYCGSLLIFIGRQCDVMPGVFLTWGILLGD